MDFVAVVDQAISLLRQRGRLTYRTLQLQFQLDAEHLEALKDELIEGQRLAVDEAGRAALAGERKQVTVLFADLKDSTELIRGLDPEAAQQLLDPALHHMMDAVHRFEGTVNQVLGDGIMALFGAPIAHEDHALRACYAALAMQAAMQPYTEEVRRTRGLELHMGYSAVGETTVLAARMEQTATPGSIRLTPSTLGLVEGLVRVHALGPVPVKGLSEPVEVFELVGASALRRRLQAAARGLT